jgi:UDP-N-acetylglucosamine 2-epimerase (non-hydrolysing)
MLNVGSGSHATQTARVMERIEPVLEEIRPDLVLVPGDINSTLAAAIVAAKLEIPIAHLEAGLRSFDRSMPEELNRMMTDQLSSLLFTHSPEARDNLLREGVEETRIHAVGNTMIDTLVAMRSRIESARAPERHGLPRGRYAVVTLHRPALVDDPTLLVEAVRALRSLSEDMTIVFPVHPRTRASMDRHGIKLDGPHVRLMEPLGYVEFLSLLSGAAAAITDSGGIQEETTHLGIPCFTLRENTERPITCSSGTNVLLGLRPHRLAQVPEMLAHGVGAARRPAVGWDGAAAERVVDVVERGILPWDAPKHTHDGVELRGRGPRWRRAALDPVTDTG